MQSLANAKVEAGNACHAVAFRIYDLDNTGWIEPGEIKRFLAALLQDNPAITLNDADIDRVVDQVCPSSQAPCATLLVPRYHSASVFCVAA